VREPGRRRPEDRAARITVRTHGVRLIDEERPRKIDAPGLSVHQEFRIHTFFSSIFLSIIASLQF
jgi:hypothetical protein